MNLKKFFKILILALQSVKQPDRKSIFRAPCNQKKRRRRWGGGNLFAITRVSVACVNMYLVTHTHTRAQRRATIDPRSYVRLCKCVREETGCMLNELTLMAWYGNACVSFDLLHFFSYYHSHLWFVFIYLSLFLYSENFNFYLFITYTHYSTFFMSMEKNLIFIFVELTWILIKKYFEFHICKVPRIPKILVMKFSCPV